MLVSGIGIAAVERETGIGKDTLRVWERRYGFPAPMRDPAGERLYQAHEVQRLRLLKRLLDAGHRPGRIVAASDEALQALAANSPGPDASASLLSESADPPELIACIERLKSHDVQGLRQVLSQTLLKRGLGVGVIDVIAPTTRRVGELWMRGELQVFEEHVYSEVLQQVLRQAIQSVPSLMPLGAPRVLLTTLPGEPHGLGLLMVEALLTLEGCACLSLGVQTPLEQLPAAAAAHNADVVALSFSAYLAPRPVLEGLTRLRTAVPAATEIWAGGHSRGLRQLPALEGVAVLAGLEKVAAQVGQWRAAHPSEGLPPRIGRSQQE
jgi:DNA-binding transcriptional MerR regulator/methylmalonyl-CoA mutase cobalamin-binding subunit